MVERYRIGEIAQKLQISTRTLRFYDQKGLLKPTKAKNGYRFYTEEQMRQLHVIIYLKELGFSLAKIKTLLEDKHASESLTLLVNVQLQSIKQEISKLKLQQKQLCDLQKILNNSNKLKLIDLTKVITKEKTLKKFRRKMLAGGLILDVIEILGIILAFYFKQRGNNVGIFASIAVMLLLVLIGVFRLTQKYYGLVAYLCPQCGQIFVPSFKTFLFTPHTPKMRRLRCPNCNKRSYCLEIRR